MTQERINPNDNDVEIIPMDWADVVVPDFINDPMENITNWVNTALPEDIRGSVLEKIRSEREKQSPPNANNS